MIAIIKKNKGFTLVEVIVSLAIIAILGAVTIPSFASYVERTKKSMSILECRSAVAAAQVLYSENFDNPDVVTPESIAEMASLSGTVSGIELTDSDPAHLTYTNREYAVTYCRDYESCEHHQELYNLSEPGDPEDPGGEEPSVYYFYIADDHGYRVSSLGDLETYDFGTYGSVVPEGGVFYYRGDYYYTRDAQYLTNSSNRAQYIANYGVKINRSRFITPDTSTVPGDLKLEGGSVYIFFPYNRFLNDYADPNYWRKVTVG